MEQHMFYAYRHAVVICRDKKGHYLVVKYTNQQGWQLPGGKAQLEESFIQAALRYCIQETTILINIKGIIQIEHGLSPDSQGIKSLNVYFYAEPANESNKPKLIAEGNQIKAEFMSFQQILKLKWRSQQILKYPKMVEHGCKIYPFDILSEGKYQKHLNAYIFKAYRHSVVICRNKELKYLVVQETEGRGWWLPSGKLQKQETFLQAAYRECLQETEVKVQIKGIIKIEPGVCDHDGIRCLNVYYYAEPVNEHDKPKTFQDKNSERAAFKSIQEIQKLKWRFKQVYICTKYVFEEGIIYPLEIFQQGHYQK